MWFTLKQTLIKTYFERFLAREKHSNCILKRSNESNILLENVNEIKKS